MNDTGIKTPTIRESKQQKARRLIAEYYAEHAERWNYAPMDPDDLRILWLTKPTAEGWSMVMYMIKPATTFWEVTYKKTDRTTTVNPHVAFYGAEIYPDGGR